MYSIILNISSDAERLVIVFTKKFFKLEILALSYGKFFLLLYITCHFSHFVFQVKEILLIKATFSNRKYNLY